RGEGDRHLAQKERRLAGTRQGRISLRKAEPDSPQASHNTIPKQVTVFWPLTYFRDVSVAVPYTSTPQPPSQGSACPGWRQGAPSRRAQVSHRRQPPQLRCRNGFCNSGPTACCTRWLIWAWSLARAVISSMSKLSSIAPMV